MRTFTGDFTRRRFLRTTAAGAGGLALMPASRLLAQEVAFSWANWNDAPAVAQLYRDILSNYQNERGVQVDQQANVEFSDYNTRMRVLLASGEPPDVMRLNDDFLREMSDKGLLTDLTPFVEASGLDMADYFEDVFNFTQMANGLNGITIGVSPRVLYYNKTAFEAAGVPLPPSTWTMDGWTWDDFLAAAQALTGGQTQYGALLTLDTGNEQAWPVNNGGTGIFSEDGREFTLAVSPNVEAIQWLADLTLVHGVQPTWGEVQAVNADRDMFINQTVAMRTGPMSDFSSFSSTITDFEWGIAPLPGKVEQRQNGGNTLFIVPEAADDKQAAFDFLTYLAGEEGGSLFASNAAFIPVNRAAAAKIGEGDSVAAGDLSLFVEAAAHQTNTNSTTATSEAVATYRPMLELVYSGEMTAEEALGSVKEQIDFLLQES